MGGDGRLVMQQGDALRELKAGEVVGQGAVWHPGANRVTVPRSDHGVAQSGVDLFMQPYQYERRDDTKVEHAWAWEDGG